MFKNLAATLGLALVTMAGAASATTIQEIAVGEFSGIFDHPTIIAAGVTSISGRWSFQNDYDILSLVLPAGQQSVTLTFNGVAGFGDSYSAGGALRYSTSAFPWAWAGTEVPGGVNFGSYNAAATIVQTIFLDDSFGGNLWLGLYGTNPNPLTYTIASSATQPAAIPLPAGLALMLTALGGLGAVALRRRRI